MVFGSKRKGFSQNSGNSDRFWFLYFVHYVVMRAWSNDAPDLVQGRWLKKPVALPPVRNNLGALFMFSIHGPKIDPRHPPRIPLCPGCGKKMRIARSEPSPHYTNLATRTYKCDHCGETAEYMVSR